MPANLCVESHLRELLERGFEVVIAADATAAAKLPGLDGMIAALINFTMLASDVWTTSTAVEKMTTAALAEPTCTVNPRTVTQADIFGFRGVIFAETKR